MKLQVRVLMWGGGPGNTLSLLELVEFLKRKLDNSITYSFGDWRPGDQGIYISDIRKVKRLLDWRT